MDIITQLEHVRDHGLRTEADVMAINEAIRRLDRAERAGMWEYYTNDEGKPRWRCSNCGKVARRDPAQKLYCSTCGARMRKGY